MIYHYKKLDNLKAEVWIEDFIDSQKGWKVVSIAKVILKGDSECLIDDIRTPFPFRGNGYATKIVDGLLDRFNKVEPIGVLSESQGFWDKFDMVDALGSEQ